MKRNNWKKQQQDALMRKRRGLLAPRFGEPIFAVSGGRPDFEAGLSAAERRALSAIYAALDRLERGSYERCRCCGGVIERVRLESIPWVDECAGCADTGLQHELPTQLVA